MDNANQLTETATQATDAVAAVTTDLNFIQEVAKFMNEGGIFMYIILVVWALGIVISIERIRNLFRYDADGPSIMNQIKKNVLTNEVQTAIQNCSDTASILPTVLKNGLKRANQSKEQIQDALEASMLEAIPVVEKRLGYLALIANLSTLLGLLGTIQGLIQSFAAVANADAASKAALLAKGIATAMNTTAFGLLSAISIMVIHAVLTNKAEKIIAEVETYSVKLVDLLSTKKGTGINPNLSAQAVSEEKKDIA